jgi:branched-chain amino acid transport system substrate-binding protein
MFQRISLTASLLAIASLTSNALAAERPIHIGAIVATSGPIAFIGASERNALEMLVEQKNAQGGLDGHPIKLTVYDTEGNATKASQLARRLVESDDVDVVIGPSTTGESLVVKPIMEEAEVPFIAFAAGEKVVFPPSPYIFKVPPTDRVVLSHLFNHFAKSQIKSIAVLYANDGFGQGAADIIQDVAKKYGVTIKATEAHAPKDTDYTPQLLSLRNSGADALLYWGNNPGPTLFVRGAKALGINQPLFNGYSAATVDFIEQSGAAAEGTYVSSMHLLARDSLKSDNPIAPVVTKLADDYKARFGAYPPTFAGHPYDAVLILEAALKKIDGDFDGESLRDAIEKVELPGANGYFRFSPENHNGLDDTSGSMIMLKVQGGRYVAAE